MRMNENGIFFIFGTTKLKYIKNDSTWLILQYYGIQLFTIHKLSVFVFFLFIIMHSNTGSKKNKNILINQYLLS